MKSDFIRNIIVSISQFIPFCVLKRVMPNTVFPFYHTVSDDYLPHIANLYQYRDVRHFEKDLDFLCKKYQPISVNQFYESFLTGKKLKNTLVLSFDDGLREVADIVAPILNRKGIPAVIFVNSAFVDNKDLFYKYKISLIVDEIRKYPQKISIVFNFLKNNNILKINSLSGVKLFLTSNAQYIDEVAKILEIDFKFFLKKQKPYLNKQQILNLQKQGFTIGSHSVNHLEYQYLTFEEQVKQTQESTEFVIKEFGEKERFFAFPFTDYGLSKFFFQKIIDEKIVDLTFGTAGIKEDKVRTNIQRIPVENFASLKKSFRYEYFYYFLRKIIGKHIIYRDESK